MCDHGTCVWGFMIIAPYCARKGWWSIVGIGVDDGDVIFLVFAAEFCDEGEIPCTIERGLDLEYELGEGVCSRISSVVVAVREDAEC